MSWFPVWAVPLSKPVEEAKSAGRALTMIGTMIISLIISGIATAAWKYGWFQWFLLVETAILAVVYVRMRASVNASRWTSLE
jgi:hypothetical protein